MNARDAIIAMVRAEPGELTAEDVAKALGLPAAEVQRHVYALTRSGALLPRRYRLYDHPRAGRVSTFDTPLMARVLGLIVEKGPLSRKTLVQLLRYDTEADAPNSLKAALQALHAGGNVAPPSCLWAAKTT